VIAEIICHPHIEVDSSNTSFGPGLLVVDTKGVVAIDPLVIEMGPSAE
jgi:hypothetical protein